MSASRVVAAKTQPVESISTHHLHLADVAYGTRLVVQIQPMNADPSDRLCVVKCVSARAQDCKHACMLTMSSVMSMSPPRSHIAQFSSVRQVKSQKGAVHRSPRFSFCGAHSAHCRDTSRRMPTSPIPVVPDMPQLPFLSVFVCVFTNERTNKQTNERTDGQTNTRMDE